MRNIDWSYEAQRRQEALLRDLSSLLAIPSVKDPDTAAPGKPQGLASAQALSHVLKLAEREELRTVTIDGIVGYAEYDGNGNSGDDYIAVLSHVDVVPATGEWTTPPFVPTIRDGRIYARGAIDDKGPTIAAFYGLLIVKQLGLPLRHRVRLIVGTDEETGMNCMEAYNRHELPPLAGFTPDADFPIVHAEKGQINSQMKLRFSDSQPNEFGTCELQLWSFISGTAANMVPDSAEAIIYGAKIPLESLLRDFKEYCNNKGLDGDATSSSVLSSESVILRMRGLSAHGAVPESGNNAGLRLLEFLYKHPFYGDGLRFIHGAVELLAKDTSGEALGIACCDEVTGPLTINIGLLRFDHLSRDAFFHLNIRFPACANGQSIVATIESRIADYGFMLTTPTIKPPHEVPADHPMIVALQKIYEEETGLEASLRSTGGGTYASKLKGCVAFGPLFPGEMDTAHQSDESIAIDSLMKATVLYARAIYELANLDYPPGKES